LHQIKQMYKVIFFTILVSMGIACQKEDMTKPGLLVPLTVDQDPGLQSIPVNGTLLHVETYGDPTNPIIIMIHGGPGGDYRSLLKAKSFANDGFFVVFYDQRGTGLSKREDKSQFEKKDALQLYIDDLGSIIDQYQKSGNQKVFLIGHSWGAMLATAYVNQHPKSINGLVLAEPGGLSWTQTSEYLDRSNKIKFFAESLNDAIFPEQIFAGRSEHEVLDYKASFFAGFENAPGNTIGNPGPYPFWRNGAVVFEALIDNAEKYGFDFTTQLNQFSTNVLFMYSENNKAYGLQWAEKVSAPIQKADLKIVLNCGHEMLYFGWDDFYPKALTYLNDLK
jgi:proline iminopeptidase